MPQMVDIFIYNNDGSILYGGDGFGDLPFDIGIQKDRLTGNFGDAQNGATLDGGTLILPVNILGLTMTPGKTTPDTGAAVGDTINVNGLIGNSFSFYIVPSDEPEPVPTNPKSVSDSNLARFKDKCDETYAPMSRALPAPAGTTDAGKVPTVNSAGNGYTLQTPSGGGGKLYNHYIVFNAQGIDVTGILTVYFSFINTSADELTDYWDLVDAMERRIVACRGNTNYSVDGNEAIPIYVWGPGDGLSMGYITKNSFSYGSVGIGNLDTCTFTDTVSEI